MCSLFIEELDGPTFATTDEASGWFAFESDYALAYEAEEYAQLNRPGA